MAKNVIVNDIGIYFKNIKEPLILNILTNNLFKITWNNLTQIMENQKNLNIEGFGVIDGEEIRMILIIKKDGE